MSKISELAASLEELKRCGEALIGISEGLTALFSTPRDEAPATTAPQSAEFEEIISNEELPFDESPAEEPTAPKLPTHEEVRAILAAKSSEGHTKAIKALIKKHGSTHLSKLIKDHPEEIPALLAEVEAL